MIITDSSAVMNFIDRYFPGMKDKIDCYDSAQTSFCKSAAHTLDETWTDGVLPYEVLLDVNTER